MKEWSDFQIHIFCKNQTYLQKFCLTDGKKIFCLKKKANRIIL